MKRLGVWLLIVCLSSFTLTGCWDRIEVNDLALVLASGVDLSKKGNLEGSLQIVNPSGMSQGIAGGGGGPGVKPYLIIAATGRDIGDIAKRQQEKLSRKVFTAHRRILIIGENLARHGIMDIVDHFTREPSNRLRSYVLITKGTTAKKILEQAYPLERIPSEGMREMERSQLTVETTMKDLVTMLSTEGQDPICATVTQVDGKSQDRPGFRLFGSAIFRDGKLVQYLDDKLTRGILWVRNESREATITFPIPGQNGLMSAVLIRSKSKVKPEVNGKQVTMHIRIKTEGYITENNTKLDLSNPKYVQLCNINMGKAIEQRIREAIQTTQEHDTDPCGFGDIIHRSQPELWQGLKSQWRGIIPKVKVDVQVDGQIRRVGMEGAGLQWKQNEVKK